MPAWNMAVDEALLRLVGEPVLRVYAWDGAAQSLGYFQPAGEAIPGVPMVRRYTGGGLVDHRGDVTYTLVFPRAHRISSLCMAESYRLAHEGVVKALEAAGLAGAVLVETADPDPAAACFHRAVRYDVRWGRDKVAGAAQRRTREGLLHQGSIRVEPWEASQRERLRAALLENLPGALGEAGRPSGISADERARAAALERTRYGTDAWNRQR